MTKTALDLTEDERDTYHLAYPPQSGEPVTPPEIDMRTCEQRELRIANCEFWNEGIGREAKARG